MNYTRNTDSKNRKFAPAFFTVWTPSRVENGDTVSEMGKIEFDSDRFDLDDGTKDLHKREVFDLSLAVQLGVYTIEEAQTLEELIRRGSNALDYMNENKPQETVEE